MPGSSKWSLSLRFPQQNPEYTHMHMHIKKDRPRIMRNLKEKDTYMKIRRQFSQVLKPPSREKSAKI